MCWFGDPMLQMAPNGDLQHIAKCSFLVQLSAYAHVRQSTTAEGLEASTQSTTLLQHQAVKSSRYRTG